MAKCKCGDADCYTCGPAMRAKRAEAVDLFGDVVPVRHTNAHSDQPGIPFEGALAALWFAEEWASGEGLRIEAQRIDGTFRCHDGNWYAVERNEAGQFEVMQLLPTTPTEKN